MSEWAVDESRWLTLPLGSVELQTALWCGKLGHEGQVYRPVPRELISEGARKKVLVALEPLAAPRCSFWRRWFFSLRADRGAFVLLTAAWVALLGSGLGLNFDALQAVLAVLGVLALQLSVNAFSEVEDTLRLLDLSRWYGPDREVSAILEGWVTPRRLWIIAWGLLGLALICGAPLLWWNTTALLPMAAMAAIAGWGYAQPPLSLKYRGWGELAILLASGPALVLALSWCFFGRWNLAFVALGFCVGFWNLALHHAGNLLDAERDRDQGAVTWVTLFGFRKARWLVLIFYFLAWVSLFPAISGVELNPIWVLGLALLFPFQLQFALRLSRASGCHSVWLAGLRKRASRVQWLSYGGALAWTWGVIQIFGGLK